MEAGKWYMVGCPFIQLSDAEGAKIGTMMSGFEDGDRLYLYDNASGSYTAIREWRDGAWREGTADDTVAEDILTPGQGFFIRKAADALGSTATFAGKVSATEVASYGSEDGNNWSMVTFCYPVETAISDLTWTALEDGDRLYLYDNASSSYTAIREWRDGAWREGTADDTLATDVLTPGQGFYVRKTSAGTGTLKK